MKNLLKSKSFLKILSASLVTLTIGISSLSIMSSSRKAYDEYYNNIMSEKEYQDYLQTLPLTLEGLSVSLSDTVTYFDDGFANPTKSDFVVTAHFSEKGKAFDKILKEDDFDIVIPEDFATNGGKISVSYTFQPEGETEDGEPLEPIIKSADLDLVLTRVAVKELHIIDMPYRVYYSDNMEFDPEGITLEARYNNGKTQLLTADQINVEKPGKLIAGSEFVEVSYTINETKVIANVPVKVDAASVYNDGEITSIVAEGENYAIEGELLSTCTPLIRATYANGNRLYIDSSKYVVTANVDRASFLKNCILTIALKDNPLVTCKTIVSVRYQLETEDATLVGGNEKQVEEQVYNSLGSLEPAGNVTVMDNFTTNDKVTFTINSTGTAKGNLYVRASNVGTSDISLNKFITMKINNRVTPIYASSVANSETCYVFNNYQLCVPVLNDGENLIELTFDKDIATKVAFDKFVFETKYDGVFYDSIDSYLAENLKSGNDPELDVTRITDWEKVLGGTYMHGLCTDGEYIYATRTTYTSDGIRGIMVSKTDPSTGEIVATSVKSEAKSSEANAGLTVVGDKIVIFFSDGTEMAIDKSLSGSWEVFDGFNFEGLESTALRDVCYNTKTQQYAVLVRNSVHVFDKEHKSLSSFSLKGDGYLAVKRITVTEDHIYALYSGDGHYQPVVQVYDWNGEYVGRFVINNNVDVMGSVVTATKKTNCQGLVFLNDELYVSILKFSTDNGGDAASLIKASYAQVPDELEINLTLSEKIVSYIDEGTSFKLNAEPSIGSIGTINSDVSGYAMGGVSDGKYLYYGVNTSENKDATVIKVNPTTYEEVAKSASIVGLSVENKDNARLFIKDENLYCIGRSNKIFYCPLNQFADRCNFKEIDLDVESLTTIKDIAWDDNAGRYAVMSESELIITDNNANELSRKSITKSGWTASSITADEKYIFVSYTTNNNGNIPVDMYTWDGQLVSSLTINGFTLGVSSEKAVRFNVQALFIHKGVLHASVCSWDSGFNKYHDWTVKISNDI